MPPSEPSAEPIAPRVSVVLASRNCKDTLRGCLDALVGAGAGMAGLEVVSVDLGSRDGSDEVDAEYPWLVMMHLPRNFGLTRGRNVGIRVAQSEFVVLMDPRVRVEPDTLVKMAGVLDDRSDAAAAICQVVDENGATLNQVFPLPGRAELGAACRANEEPEATAPAGELVQAARGWLIMVRRRFIAGMNYLDEKRYWDTWSEVDLFRQVRSSGKKTLYVEAARAVLAGEEQRAKTVAGRALEASDRVAGACSYLAKQEGFFSGFTLKLGLALRSFGRVLAFNDPGYHLRLLGNLFDGSKVDGTQGGELS